MKQLNKMKRWLLCIFSTLSLLPILGQELDSVLLKQQGNPWNGTYFNEQYRINLRLDLDSATLIAPGFEQFGKVNGYLSGGIYGTWFLVRYEKSENGIRLRFTNDLGSYVQVIDWHRQPDGTFTYDAIGSNEMRRAEGRKLIKIEPHLVFIPKLP